MTQAGQLGLFEAQTQLYRRANARGVPLDVCARKHKGNPQSVEANKAVQPTKEATRRKVLAWFVGRGRHGGTADECVAAFGSTHNHIAPRVTELVHDPRCVAMRLVRAGRKRQTRSGGWAAVLVAQEFAT